MNEVIQKLTLSAAAASPGHWRAHGYEVGVWVEDNRFEGGGYIQPTIIYVQPHEGGGCERKEDAAYIANMDPQTARALLGSWVTMRDALEAAKRYIEDDETRRPGDIVRCEDGNTVRNAIETSEKLLGEINERTT